MLLALAVVVVAATVVAAKVPPGCGQDGAVDSATFGKLMAELKANPFSFDRQEIIKNFVADNVAGLRSNQTIALANLFDNAILRVEVLEMLGPLLLGVTCDDLANGLLEPIHNSFGKMDALKALVNATVDLKQNNATILAQFSNTFTRRDAKSVIDAARPRSCVFGDPRSVKRVIFVVDTSGSMGERFRDADGNTVTRMSYVSRELVRAIDTLDSDQEFNVISFSNSPRAWQPGVVPVDAQSRTKAQQFASALTAGGGTNMLDALRLAYKDTRALGIFLLSDGMPNSAAGLVQEATGWSSQLSARRPLNTIALFAPAQAQQLLKSLAEATQGAFRAINK
mmetsp:Transcript_46036/g.112891  ORF Transcript_46036/g.112891 Transcript_46036/m.112891 type:complete len:339 (+) Transcript_46036:63-1079(+)